MPNIYIPHGGGPLPLLGETNHNGLVSFLQNVTKKFDKPESIVIISAHWEEKVPTVTNNPNPELIYDYYGFPQESYRIKYPANGNPALAQEIYELLDKNDFNSKLNGDRGFDHGMFVPLKLMYPNADIPCIQLSLINNLNPKLHIDIGRAISGLNVKNILIIGSGMSFHNLRDLLNPHPETLIKSIEFDDWLKDTLTNPDKTVKQRELRLIDWLSAPNARHSHPREEHLLPLHVCFGIVSNNYSVPQIVFNEELMGSRVSAILWK